MTVKLKYAALLFMLLLPAAAQARTERFKYPDIRNEFCGAHIGFQYCKCAFHGELCGTIGKDRGAANQEVQKGYDAYAAGLIENFARGCMKAGGIYSVVNEECEYCEGGKVRDQGVCADPKDKRPLEEVYGLPKVETKGGSNNVGYVVVGEGEFFVFSPGRGKWIGPVRGGLSLYEGDVLFTTQHGRAQLRIGNANVLMLDRTMLTLPTPERQRSFLERGALYIWESIKRLADDRSAFEIEEGGAHSIAGIKGTKFVMESADGAAKYALNEGAIDVWSAANPSSKLGLKAGEGAAAAPSGVERSAYDWDALVKKYDLGRQDLSEPTAPKTFAPIDPDAVNPPETAYTGELVGKGTSKSGNGYWPWLAALAVAAGVAYVIKSRSNDQ